MTLSLFQADLETQQSRELREVNQAMEDELHHAQRQVDDQMDQQKNLVIDEHKAKFDREMLLQGKNVSEEEFDRLMKAHQAEMAALEINYMSQKDRQKQSLADKVTFHSILHLKNLHAFLIYLPVCFDV